MVLIWVKGARGFGGKFIAAGSVLAESAFSALLAPVRMLFHTQFVFSSLFGWAIQWHSPPRADTQTGWGEALRRHGWHSLLGAVWAGFVYWLNPTFLWWLLPVVGALVVSIPLSVCSSRISLGRKARAYGLFLIPEESLPPAELSRTGQLVALAHRPADFACAVVDPTCNAVACAASVARLRANPSTTQLERSELTYEALVRGPSELSTEQRIALLNDPLALSELHLAVWASEQAHPDWRRACRQISPASTR